VTVFFATSQEGLQNAEEQKNGYYWIYEESYVLNQGQGVAPPIKKLVYIE